MSKLSDALRNASIDEDSETGGEPPVSKGSSDVEETVERDTTATQTKPAAETGLGPSPEPVYPPITTSKAGSLFKRVAQRLPQLKQFQDELESARAEASRFEAEAGQLKAELAGVEAEDRRAIEERDGRINVLDAKLAKAQGEAGALQVQLDDVRRHSSTGPVAATDKKDNEGQKGKARPPADQTKASADPVPPTHPPIEPIPTTTGGEVPDIDLNKMMQDVARQEQEREQQDREAALRPILTQLHRVMSGKPAEPVSSVEAPSGTTAPVPSATDTASITAGSKPALPPPTGDPLVDQAVYLLAEEYDEVVVASMLKRHKSNPSQEKATAAFDSAKAHLEQHRKGA